MNEKSRDVCPDTWTCTDDEGRVTPIGNGSVGNKKVGIFYFLWHDADIHKGDGKLYDHTATYYGGGIDALHKVITEGPVGFAHYCSEPYFGYYRSNDEWVIRKHTYQLTATGVDFWFIDATNGLTYEKSYETILKVWSQMRAEGCKTPKICFHCGNEKEISRLSFNSLWDNLYSSGRYEDFWFLHNGKPLIFLPKNLYDELGSEKQDFFTVRHSWADSNGDWYRDLDGKNCWPWADMYPQKPGRSASGVPEQMIVMSGFWVNGSFGTNAGRSYHNGIQPSIDKGKMGFDLVDIGSSGKGYGFEEQFDYAIRQNPDIIMLVGWNEWWAGRWEAGPAVSQTIANSYKVVDDDSWMRNYYVDSFNPEFSRDIEPMKGIYNDNYYCQMVQNIRKFKGARSVQSAFGSRLIDINGPLEQWFAVGPEYRDFTEDTAKRDCDSYVGGFHYVNNSGRNDFKTCKVSVYGEDVFFYAECTKEITSPEGTNWMNLFIDADCNSETGWHGYDYVINRDRDADTCSVRKFVKNRWETEEVGRADYAVVGNVIQIRVPVSLLNIGTVFDFKWADNSVDSGNVMQFIDLGDTAPSDRFNYRYSASEAESITPPFLDPDALVLKVGSYNAICGGKTVMLDTSNTNAVFISDGKSMFLPRDFAENVIGLNISAEQTFERRGVTFVDVSRAINELGRVVSVSKEADLMVICKREYSESEMLTLYRCLY